MADRCGPGTLEGLDVPEPRPGYVWAELSQGDRRLFCWIDRGRRSPWENYRGAIAPELEFAVGRHVTLPQAPFGIWRIESLGMRYPFNEEHYSVLDCSA